MSSWFLNKRVAVLGGAAMIGSALVEALIDKGVADIWVADDLSSGRKDNLPQDVRLLATDLREYSAARRAVLGADIVFQLAAAHGGRAFVDTHALECLQNFEIDTAVFRACADSYVNKVLYMSSACAYDTTIQQDVTSDVHLSENLIDYKKPIMPDNEYGEQKYVSEKILNAYVAKNLFAGVVARGFTVYGPAVSLTHFIGAAIANTYTKQDPLIIFGDGHQKRNWTFVSDTARGLMLAMEKLSSGVVNIGTEEARTPNDVYNILWNMFGWKPTRIEYRQQFVGPTNRVADATKAKEQLGWIPAFTFQQGLEKTVSWMTNKYSVDDVKELLKVGRFER